MNELAAVSEDIKPDIILLTETWCNDSIVNVSLQLPGYNLETDLRRDRVDTGGGVGGGLLVYSREGLKIVLNDKHMDNTFNQFCDFKIATGGQPLNIVLVYRPPSAGADNTEKLCEILRKLETNTIVIGDFNLPGVVWEEREGGGAKARQLVETVEKEGLQQMVSFPTHVKGNILDLVLTNCLEKIVSITDVGRLGKSDHCMIEVTVAVRWEERRRSRKVVNWRKANYEEMRLKLNKVDWKYFMENQSAEMAWKKFREEVNKAVEKYAPSIEIRRARRPDRKSVV